ncbi:hypothetical protein F2P81_012948 [Scophthalmus maximus]|uniref:Uncharacterized protein n=1 Tax=Scophthalmus maximus TaxID=52904 RepID=A0A6A4STG0_SCOMX|nr:hypothetical protein F2P81_012948 [Scophthalmus maximus]
MLLCEDCSHGTKAKEKDNMEFHWLGPFQRVRRVCATLQENSEHLRTRSPDKQLLRKLSSQNTHVSDTLLIGAIFRGQDLKALRGTFNDLLRTVMPLATAL